MCASPKPRRFRFQFTLRTLLLLITAVACGAFYHLNWIRARRELLAASHVYYSHDPQRLDGANFVIVPPPQTVPAPGLLWLFGERGVASLELPVEEQRFDSSAASDSYEEVRRARELFPEARHIEAYPLLPLDE